jgi:hypothetical protein
MRSGSLGPWRLRHGPDAITYRHHGLFRGLITTRFIWSMGGAESICCRLGGGSRGCSYFAGLCCNSVRRSKSVCPLRHRHGLGGITCRLDGLFGGPSINRFAWSTGGVSSICSRLGGRCRGGSFLAWLCCSIGPGGSVHPFQRRRGFDAIICRHHALFNSLVITRFTWTLVNYLLPPPWGSVQVTASLQGRATTHTNTHIVFGRGSLCPLQGSHGPDAITCIT